MVLSASQWRRGLAGIGFLLALGFLASRSCATESASAEIRFAADPALGVQAIEVELLRPGHTERVGHFAREVPHKFPLDVDRSVGRRGTQGAPQPPPRVLGRWPLRVDPGTYRLAFTVRATSGTWRGERSVQLTDRAVVTVPIEEPSSRR